MQHCDIFVILTHCQFEKNGFQNRCKVYEKWWTMPVNHGLKNIDEKLYTNGTRLVDVNKTIIFAMAMMLGIEISKIKFDFETSKKGTERLIEIIKYYGGDVYLTSPEAKEKYLDEDLMRRNGIEIEYIMTPHTKHVFEMFHEFGIEGTRAILQKR